MKETGQEVYSLPLLLCRDEQQGDNHTYMPLGPAPPVTACSPVEKHFSFRSRLKLLADQFPTLQSLSRAVNSTIPHISAAQICSAGSYQNHHWSIIVPSLCNTKRISKKPLLSRPPATCSGRPRFGGKNKKAKKQKEAISDKGGATQKVCFDSCS